MRTGRRHGLRPRVCVCDASDDTATTELGIVLLLAYCDYNPGSLPVARSHSKLVRLLSSFRSPHWSGRGKMPEPSRVILWTHCVITDRRHWHCSGSYLRNYILFSWRSHGGTGEKINNAELTGSVCLRPFHWTVNCSVTLLASAEVCLHSRDGPTQSRAATTVEVFPQLNKFHRHVQNIFLQNC